MTTQPIKANVTEGEVSNMQPTDADKEFKNMETKLQDIEQVHPEAMEIELIDLPVRIGAEAHEIPAVEEAEPMEIDNKTELEETRPMDIEVAKPKLVHVEAKETKAQDTKKVIGQKQLPFDLAKINKTKVDKSKGTKLTGSRPNGVKKPTRPLQRGKGGASLTLDGMLTKERKWIKAPSSYMIRNPESGCFGLSCRRAEGERPEITIAHTVDCECLDVRLMHICQHVERLVKQRQLARRSRDIFVIITKIQKEPSQPIPKEVRFPVPKKQVIRRPKKEVEAEDTIINVVEEHRQQKLIEKWKNLEAYKKRLIWKDW
ncbi:hypothetical protein GGR58DRAFT_185058 [Xylaria digitata]|nr:hypothetical protein GGR58DRAFT_185058 [Xylaria digitata]